MRYAARTDANHSEIRTALRNVGAYVVDTFTLRNAFDMLVAFRGELYVFEIKDGKKPKSKQKLTPGEQECMQNFERAGVTYHIIKSIDDALQAIGATSTKTTTAHD